MHKHCENMRRAAHVVNLDPAAEYFDYPVIAGKLPILNSVNEHNDVACGRPSKPERRIVTFRSDTVNHFWQKVKFASWRKRKRKAVSSEPVACHTL